MATLRFNCPYSTISTFVERTRFVQINDFSFTSDEVLKKRTLGEGPQKEEPQDVDPAFRPFYYVLSTNVDIVE